MGYISKLDTKYLTFMSRKYAEHNVQFEYFDDYILFLYDLVNNNDDKYYEELEKDLQSYVEFQSGKER